MESQLPDSDVYVKNKGFHICMYLPFFGNGGRHLLRYSVPTLIANGPYNLNQTMTSQV